MSKKIRINKAMAKRAKAKKEDWRELKIPASIYLDVQSIPDDLWEDICQIAYNDLLTVFHSNGTIHFFNISTGDVCKEVRLTEEIKKEIEENPKEIDVFLAIKKELEESLSILDKHIQKGGE